MGSFSFPPLLFHYVISGPTGAKDPVGKVISPQSCACWRGVLQKSRQLVENKNLVAKITARSKGSN
jgi:hypothetical protein